MKTWATILGLALAFSTEAMVRLASNSTALVKIIIAKECAAPTKFASDELAKTLESIVGGKFEIVGGNAELSAPAVFVGASTSAKAAFPEIDFSKLASEEIAIKTREQKLLLAGGGARGDIYAVMRFLQDQCGVRWWTAWASRVPTNANLTVGKLDIRYRPRFELREPFWMPAFDPLWAVRNTCNGQSARIPAEWGGCLRYKGFVHVQPHPNWFTLGPNVRYFETHKVRGVFEQGAYQSHGSEMAEMRAWVLAQLLWNPRQDDRALIREFLEGYFGAAARPIENYFERMHEASKGSNLTCYSPTDAPFLQYQHLAPAEELWTKAEKAVENDAELRTRVQLARLPLRYVWLKRWQQLREQAGDSTIPWPLPDSRQTVIDEWKPIVQGKSGKHWTKVTMLNEAGLTPEEFLTMKNLKN